MNTKSYKIQGHLFGEKIDTRAMTYNDTKNHMGRLVVAANIISAPNSIPHDLDVYMDTGPFVLTGAYEPEILHKDTGKTLVKMVEYFDPALALEQDNEPDTRLAQCQRKEPVSFWSCAGHAMASGIKRGLIIGTVAIGLTFTGCAMKEVMAATESGQKLRTDPYQLTLYDLANMCDRYPDLWCTAYHAKLNIILEDLEPAAGLRQIDLEIPTDVFPDIIIEDNEATVNYE